MVWIDINLQCFRKVWNYVSQPNSGAETVRNHACKVQYIVGRKLLQLNDTGLYDDAHHFNFKIGILNFLFYQTVSVAKNKISCNKQSKNDFESL